jgi:hypothetical protein
MFLFCLFIMFSVSWVAFYCGSTVVRFERLVRVNDGL